MPPPAPAHGGLPHRARIVAPQVFVEFHRRQFRSDAVAIDGHHRAVLQLD